MKSPFTATVLVLVGYVAYLQLSGRIEAAMQFNDPEATARFKAIDWDFDGWRSTPVEVPADLKQLMGADAVVHRIYESRQHRLDVWINHYTNIAEGATHSPEVCMKLSNWRKTSFRKTARDGPEAIPMSIERYTRDGRELMVASTFFVGRRTYATQPEAKLALVRDPAPLVFAMVSAAVREGAPPEERAARMLVQAIARRVQQGSPPAKSE